MHTQLRKGNPPPIIIHPLRTLFLRNVRLTIFGKGALVVCDELTAAAKVKGSMQREGEKERNKNIQLVIKEMGQKNTFNIA